MQLELFTRPITGVCEDLVINSPSYRDDKSSSGSARRSRLGSLLGSCDVWSFGNRPGDAFVLASRDAVPPQPADPVRNVPRGTNARYAGINDREKSPQPRVHLFGRFASRSGDSKFRAATVSLNPGIGICAFSLPRNSLERRCRVSGSILERFASYRNDPEATYPSHYIFRSS